MQVNFSEKQIILELDDFRTPDGAGKAFNQLISVMIYPTDQDKQRLFLLGEKSMILDEHPSKTEKEDFLKSNPKVTFDLLMSNPSETKQAVIRAMHSRQGGGKGGLLMRGKVAGTILQYLRQTESLKAAFELYLQRPQGYRDESGNTEPIQPSMSSLREIWDYSLPTVHIWAAHVGFHYQYDIIPYCAPRHLRPQILDNVASASSSWREFLLTSRLKGHPQ